MDRGLLPAREGPRGAPGGQALLLREDGARGALPHPVEEREHYQAVHSDKWATVKVVRLNVTRVVARARFELPSEGPEHSILNYSSFNLFF